MFLFRTYAGFQLQVGGLAPAAARYAGFSSRRALWIGAAALGRRWPGLAGALEVAGPLGQLTPYVPAGYGFAAIIVAFVGRLHPVGIVFSAILMSMFYIGGELAQSRLGLPKSLTGVFQGLLLFTLLACDTLIAYRVRWRASRQARAAATRRLRGGSLMDSCALLLAATLNAGTVLALAGARPADQRARRHRQPRRRGHDAGAPRSPASPPPCTPAATGSASAPARGAGALLAAAFGVLVIWLNTNQYATGLALSLFGAGFSAFVGIRYVQEKLPRAARASRIPGAGATSRFVGPALFRQHPMVYLAVALTVGARLVPLPLARRAWCCARSASRPSRRMRSATRCGASASPRWSSAARCAAWRAPTSRSSTRRSGSRAWSPARAGSRWR